MTLSPINTLTKAIELVRDPHQVLILPTQLIQIHKQPEYGEQFLCFRDHLVKRPLLVEFSKILVCEGTCEGPGRCETKAVLKLTSRLSGILTPALLRP